MLRKKREVLIYKRLLIWAVYLFSGYVLYLKKDYLFSFFIIFAKVIYPLSIFWVQIRLKSKINFFPIDSSMDGSELWFNILPVLASFITVILSLINLIFYITDKLILVS